MLPKIIVEQFIGKSLPTEYKFHVINGTIAAIDVVEGRGTTCPCYAVVDTDWNRLDKFGCFEPGGIDMIDTNTQCTEIDFVTGLKRMGPVKKDMYLCFDIDEPKPCILQEMIDIALALGVKIGVAIRVDMFVVDDRVYVQGIFCQPHEWSASLRGKTRRKWVHRQLLRGAHVGCCRRPIWWKGNANSNDSEWVRCALTSGPVRIVEI
jgi:hypothetical protein